MRPKLRIPSKHPKVAQLSELGKRIEAELTERGWSKSYLASRIAKWTTTRVTGTMTQTPKGPTMESVCALAGALGVTTDYLLLGRKPKRPSQEREPVALESDIAGEVRRQLFERLRWPKDERHDDRFNGLTLEHLEVNGTALLAWCVDECERRFRADTDGLLDDAHKGQYSERQAEVIAALVQALPLTQRARIRAAQAAWQFGLESGRPPYNPNADTAPVTITDDGIAALLSWWEWPDSTEASERLLRLARRTAQFVKEQQAR